MTKHAPKDAQIGVSRQLEWYVNICVGVDTFRYKEYFSQVSSIFIATGLTPSQKRYFEVVDVLKAKQQLYRQKKEVKARWMKKRNKKIRKSNEADVKAYQNGLGYVPGLALSGDESNSNNESPENNQNQNGGLMKKRSICGADDHLRTNSKKCRLNKKNMAVAASRASLGGSD